MKAFDKHAMKITYHGPPRSKAQRSVVKAAPSISQPVQGMQYLPVIEREELIAALSSLAAGNRGALGDLVGMYLFAAPGGPLHTQVAAFFTANSLPLSPSAMPDEVVHAASAAAREFLRQVSTSTAPATQPKVLPRSSGQIQTEPKQ